MRTINIHFPEINKEISYLVGKNKRDNFAVIDEGVEDDLWFHAKDDSSCHVLCILPNELILTEQQKRLLVQKGAEICKIFTRKLTSLHKVPILYTEIKNVTKTKTLGLVNAINTNTIVVTEQEHEKTFSITV